MEKLKQLKTLLIWAVVVVLALKVIVWAVQPLLPFLLVALAMTFLAGVLLFRRKL